jgi:very-short-patch-repair endonuclease
MATRLTNKEFIDKANTVHKNKYDYSLVNYNNNRLKVKVICKEHGLFEQEAGSHLKGCGCPKCFGFNQTISDFISQANKFHKNKYDYSLINNINNRKEKVKIICPEHGVFEQIVSNHLHKSGCRKCHFENRILTTKEFVKKARNVHGNLYNYSLTEYEHSRLKIKIVCNKHGAFEQKPNKHLNGQGCPFCKLSKGEIKIKDFLDKNKIIYTRQKKFDECKNTFKLPFDFYLPEHNILIEYDGEQHFTPVKIWGGNKGFIKQKNNDEIKTKFAQKQGIKLVRIRYNKIKLIEEILKKELSPI